VASALRVLVALSETSEPIGISDLSRRLGVGKSSMHAILATLADLGFVEQAPGSPRYRLGFVAFEVGAAVLEQLKLGAYLTPPMERLAHESQEAVSLAVLHDRSAVFVHRFESTHVLRADIRLGTRMPLHGSASGKCLLSELSHEEIKRLYPTDELDLATPRTIRRRAELLDELERVRQLGYATDLDEYVVGVSAVACPVRNGEGRTVAALSVAGPSARFEGERWIARMLAIAEEMNRVLGPMTTGELRWQAFDLASESRRSPGRS